MNALDFMAKLGLAQAYPESSQPLKHKLVLGPSPAHVANGATLNRGFFSFVRVSQHLFGQITH